jgi:spermidine synthase
MYQMIAARSFTLIAGSTAPAICALLATFLGSIAIGAWLGGRIAAQRGDALKLYSYSQMGIGLFCLATPWIFQGVQGFYFALAASIPPAVLMGMGLPLLARFCQDRTASLGASIAVLCRAGIIGAAIGAPLAGCLLIPTLGMLKATLVTALLHLVVAALALRFSGLVAGQTPATAAQLAGTSDDRSLGTLALALLALGGAIALGLGVNYVHLLAVVAGDSVYADSLMLFACLLGLAGGTEIARRLILARLPLAPCLGWIEFALAAVALLGVYQWTALTEYFSSFAFYPVADAFGTRELIRGLVACVVMVPPALAIGALFPLAIEAVGRAWPAQPVRSMGGAAALFALGGKVGVLGAGLLFLPWLGSLRSIQGLALLCLLLGIGAIGFTTWRSKPLHWAPAGAVLALFCLQPASFDYTALASGASIHFAPHHHEQVIDHAESFDGGLVTVSRRSSKEPGEASLALRANGYLLGDEGGMAAPLPLTKARARALVIGYGTGISTHALHQAGFAQMDIVEPSGDVVRLADEHFADRNGRVSQQRNVATHIADGRTFLVRQSNVYDLVSVEPRPIWFADTASFYNREFYRLAKDRLRADGVLQQRVPLHHLSPLDLLYILGSVRAEFSQVWLYSAGTQGIIVATSDPVRTSSATTLAGALLLDPARVDRLLASYGAPPSRWVSTDDNRYLEYATPRGNALDGAESSRAILEFLQRAGGASR